MAGGRFISSTLGSSDRFSGLLDDRVANHIMGCYGDHVPHYSTNLQAAIDLIEALHDRGWRVEIQRLDTNGEKSWECDIRGPGVAYDVSTGLTGRTMPIAVCRAALVAVGVPVGPHP